MTRPILPPPYRGAVELAVNACNRALRQQDRETTIVDIDTAILHLQRAKRFARETADTVRPGDAISWTAEQAASIEALVEAAE